jgi:hypothetical protein
MSYIYIYIYIYIYMECIFLMFLDHTQRRSTVVRTPLDEWSARLRDLYLTTHDTHNRQLSMPPVGVEPRISVSERPAAAHLLRSWVRLPPGEWIFVRCEWRVLSGRGLWDELITRPEEFYRLCCVVVCDLETPRICTPYIYDISHLRVSLSPTLYRMSAKCTAKPTAGENKLQYKRKCYMIMEFLDHDFRVTASWRLKKILEVST